MTKEAKIGMLTGLGVIVAIGVLLSEYLGDRNTGPSAVPGAMGKMANPQVGEDYRQQRMSPVNVQAMTPAGGGERTQLPNGSEIASPVATGNGIVPPSMYAAQPDGMSGPQVTGPVAPVPAGLTPMDRNGGGPPIVSLQDTVPVRLSTPTPGPVSNTTTARTPAPVMQSYTILPGDNLAKIAKKFYNSTKNSDIDRIVKANPGMLKDARTPLIASKKLQIPVLAATTPPAGAVAPRPVDPGVVRVPSGGVVPIPGGRLPTQPVVTPPVRDTGAHPVSTATRPVPPVATAPAPAKTYVVKSGDTLEKIAKQLAPTKVSDTVTKLISLNGLADPSKLKVGQTLKVPA